MTYYYIYLSIFGSIISIFILSRSLIIGRQISLFLYLLMSIPWVLYMGFCGQDMPTYLTLFASYSFKNPFTWSYLEFSVGLITSFAKIFLPINASAESIATAYRFWVFVFLPSVLIFYSPNKFCSTLRFLCFLFFISLSPYTFLSASNIINNGLAISLLFYFLVSVFSYNASVLRENFKISFYEWLLLFFGAFAHPFGLGIVIFALISLIVFSIIRRIGLVNVTTRFSSPLRYIAFLLPPAIISASLTISYLSSRVNDETILISSLILIVAVFLMWLCVRRLTLALNCLPKKYLTRFLGTYSFSLFILSFLIFFSFYVISLGAFGGGDAAERFIASLISWSFISVLIFNHFISLISSSYLFDDFSLNKSSIHFNSFVAFSLLCFMSFYFYNSDAFWLNIPIGGLC